MVPIAGITTAAKSVYFFASEGSIDRMIHDYRIGYLVQPSFYLGHINRNDEYNLLRPIDDILLTTMLKSTLLQLNIEE
jgi:hypothetical protein